MRLFPDPDDKHLPCPLRTKIVATVGPPRGGEEDPLLDPDGERVTREIGHGELLGWFIEAGVDVIRINMSFAGEQEEYGANERRYLEWLCEHRDGLAARVAVLGDLPGPKIRLGGIAEEIQVHEGDDFYLAFGDREPPPSEKGARVLVDNRPFNKVVKRVGGRPEVGRFVHDRKRPTTFSLGDGKVQLRAELDDAELRQFQRHGLLRTRVDVEKEGGIIKPRRGLTIKGASLELPRVFTDQDQKALDFLLEHGSEVLSFVAVSFVRTQDDVLAVKHYLEDALERLAPERAEVKAGAPAIIAKIETQEACADVAPILDVADGLMVARGDLGEQLDPWEVPAQQKRLIRLANLRGKPVITATQMLDSMERRPMPTRAEATDVFNAIVDGTDAVMLSGETSVGKYPVQAIEMMAQIARRAESFVFHQANRRSLDEALRLAGSLVEANTERLSQCGNAAARGANDPRLSPEEIAEHRWRSRLFFTKVAKSEKQATTDRICRAACSLSESSPSCQAIVALTTSGRTARMISRFRPAVPIIAAAHDSYNERKLLLSFGIYPIQIGTAGADADVADLVERAIERALDTDYLPSEPGFKILRPGSVVATSGTPLHEPGTTNVVQMIENVGRRDS